jgi:autotransporter-associated beta strand protein
MLPKSRLAVLVLSFACCSPQVASGTDRNWSGGIFGGGEFTSPDSWFDGVPTNNSNSDVARFRGFLGGPIHTTVNVSVPRGVNGIDFASPGGIAGSGEPVDFTLTGSMLTIGDGGIAISNAAGSSQVIDNPIRLADNQHWALYNDLRVNGGLSGDGNLVKDGTGTLTLSASNSNTGDIHITEGTLRIVNAGRIFDRTNIHLYRAAPSSSNLVFDGMTDAINGLHGDGNVELRNGATLVIGNSINGSQGIGNFRGDIDGNGSLVKRGPGTFVIESINEYTGGTRVESGILLIDFLGPILSATGPGPVVVTSGGSFGGRGGALGTVTVQSGGVIFPGGDSVEFADRTGLLTTGGLTLSAGATLKIDLEGRTAGVSHDQLAVPTASLAGSLAVGLLGAFTPSPGDVFEILDVENSRTGVFSGLPQGALVEQFGGIDLVISYSGGDGNDVTLTASALPGDIDLDRDVDRTDAALFAQHFGRTSLATWSTGDFDGDRAATLADLAILETQLGEVPAPSLAAIAEPNSIILMLAGLTAVAAMKRFHAARG